MERKIAFFTQTGNVYNDRNRPISPTAKKVYQTIRNLSFHGIPHLGEGIIASECAEQGWDVDVFPLSCISRKMAKAIEDYPLIMMSAIDMGVSIVEEKLKEYPKLNGKTIIGGQGISPVADEFSRRHPGIAVFNGRADFEIDRILSQFESGAELGGVEKRTRQLDLSEYGSHPSLNEEFTFHRLDIFNRSRAKSIEVTSGCTQNCEFCSIAGEKVTVKPLEVVKREIEMMGLRKTDILFFIDHNLFNLPRPYLRELFNHINSKGILWVGEGTIAQIIRDEELIRIMAKGCLVFLSGLEDINNSFAGSPAKERLIGSFDDILATLRRNSFPVTWSMVFGLNSHTPKTFLETASFIREHNLNVNCHLIQPRNGSAFQEELIREGRMYTDNSCYRDGVHLVYEPKSMTWQEAVGGYIWLKGFVARTIRIRFLNNLKIGGLRYATSLAFIETVADVLSFWRMREMYPELNNIVERYETEFNL